jgi:hypothetical protein
MLGLFAILLLLLLAGTSRVVWRNDGAVQTQDERIAPVHVLAPEATKGTAAIPPDPFKAVLEASGKNHDANPEPTADAKGDTVVPAQDPFRQALEVSKQKRSATLSSPFGVER